MDAKIPVPGPSPTSLIEKATNILEVAQAQHDAADQQHLNADKLEELGHALEASAVEIEGKNEWTPAAVAMKSLSAKYPTQPSQMTESHNPRPRRAP